jgi:hypothetical protein
VGRPHRRRTQHHLGTDRTGHQGRTDLRRLQLRNRGHRAHRASTDLCQRPAYRASTGLDPAQEQAINPYVAGIAPRLCWQVETGGWNLLGFEVIDGRPVDYSPGSTDLPKLRDTLGLLGQIPCPDLPLKHAEQRWSAFSDSPGLFAGAALLHTELSPGNVLITETSAHLVDWAWPTRGASWIDPACAVVWLIAFGHTPADAEQWAEQLPAWHTATPTHLAAFAQAQHTMWAAIAKDHPDAWLLRVTQGAHRWAEHRQ